LSTLDYFDNKWFYFLVQRSGTTVKIHIALEGSTTASQWGQLTNASTINSGLVPLQLGWSLTRLDETMKGYIDGLEVVVNGTISNPNPTDGCNEQPPAGPHRGTIFCPHSRWVTHHM
jgi:hypothetical protein